MAEEQGNGDEGSEQKKDLQSTTLSGVDESTSTSSDGNGDEGSEQKKD